MQSSLKGAFPFPFPFPIIAWPLVDSFGYVEPYESTCSWSVACSASAL